MMHAVGQALLTGAGMLWKAGWALIFGYLISAVIQVVVTREQMARALGDRGPRQTLLASFFGFVSSSCSFAALAAARAVLVKGAHPVNSLIFLVASTNLVIELGLVLWVLLGWRFVAGNFLLGALMIAFTALFTRVYFPEGLAKRATAHAEKRQEAGMGDRAALEGRSWREKLTSRAGWRAIGDAFAMEWKMAYKEILIGFTVAGFISVLVPQAFWDALFLRGGGAGAATAWWQVVENAAVAPVIAFLTFIGSMGNVPLAAMLWSRHASFGGVMSFLGADLVAATVLYLQAKYYGWRYTAYVAGVLYLAMVAAGLTVHLLFGATGLLPTARPTIGEMVAFKVDYTLWLNVLFVALSGALLWARRGGRGRGRAATFRSASPAPAADDEA